jgi:hypothetical protein
MDDWLLNIDAALDGPIEVCDRPPNLGRAGESPERVILNLVPRMGYMPLDRLFDAL